MDGVGRCRIIGQRWIAWQRNVVLVPATQQAAPPSNAAPRGDDERSLIRVLGGERWGAWRALNSGRLRCRGLNCDRMRRSVFQPPTSWLVIGRHHPGSPRNDGGSGLEGGRPAHHARKAHGVRDLLCNLGGGGGRRRLWRAPAPRDGRSGPIGSQPGGRAVCGHLGGSLGPLDCHLSGVRPVSPSRCNAIRAAPAHLAGAAYAHYRDRHSKSIGCIAMPSRTHHMPPTPSSTHRATTTGFDRLLQRRRRSHRTCVRGEERTCGDSGPKKKVTSSST